MPILIITEYHMKVNHPRLAKFKKYIMKNTHKGVEKWESLGIFNDGSVWYNHSGN